MRPSRTKVISLDPSVGDPSSWQLDGSPRGTAVTLGCATELAGATVVVALDASGTVVVAFPAAAALLAGEGVPTGRDAAPAIVVAAVTDAGKPPEDVDVAELQPARSTKHNPSRRMKRIPFRRSDDPISPGDRRVWRIDYGSTVTPRQKAT